ncbi:hypothetical protein HOLleu_08960 [Holothuria leucospilota]|uniref:Uncharacterized protein n=1 Tax=Holothuria leucospilota TaxID=206669 RepID=A0A9Q1CID7_HOLLE|nr:hypothetical protein HOLleu_08960 [Holothuria leucospilota]
MEYCQSKKKKTETKKKVHFTDDYNDAVLEHSGDGDVAVYLHSFTFDRNHHSSWDCKDGAKQLMKIDRKITDKHRKYAEEKETISQKLQEAKAHFDSEVRKYENDLHEKHEDYLTQLNQLKMGDQFISMSNRMEDLNQLEAKLNARQENFCQHEKELEETEKYLKRRQELCNRREDDLIRQTEALDTIQQELEADKLNFQGLGFDVSKIGSIKSRKLNGNMTSEKEDYILKANLRKCQLHLKNLEEQNAQLIACNESITKKLQDEKEASRKQSQKIKHLETQLSIYISQSKQGSDHLSMKSLQTNSQDKGDKLRPNRGHASMQRYLAGQLTLNQQAELRHKLRTKSSQNNTGSKQKYAQRRNSLDSGRGSSQTTAEVTSDQNVSKNRKSSICNIL